MSDPGEFAIGLSVGAVGLGFLLGPIGQAIARRLFGKGTRDPKTGLDTGEMAAARIEALEERIHELEQAAERVSELEERLEFAERVLTRLPPGVVPEPERPRA
jgi:hypothetical protein